MKKEEKETQFQIELNADIAEGSYANLAIIAHSSSEFVFDFIRVMPGMPKALVKSRIILAPEHAKRLLLALHDNITNYEARHGEIRLNEQILPNSGWMVQGGEA